MTNGSRSAARSKGAARIQVGQELAQPHKHGG